MRISKACLFSVLSPWSNEGRITVVEYILLTWYTQVRCIVCIYSCDMFVSGNKTAKERVEYWIGGM